MLQHHEATLRFEILVRKFSCSTLTWQPKMHFVDRYVNLGRWRFNLKDIGLHCTLGWKAKISPIANCSFYRYPGVKSKYIVSKAISWYVLLGCQKIPSIYALIWSLDEKKTLLIFFLKNRTDFWFSSHCALWFERLERIDAMHFEQISKWFGFSKIRVYFSSSAGNQKYASGMIPTDLRTLTTMRILVFYCLVDSRQMQTVECLPNTATS